MSSARSADIVTLFQSMNLSTKVFQLKRQQTLLPTFLIRKINLQLASFDYLQQRSSVQQLENLDHNLFRQAREVTNLTIHVGFFQATHCRDDTSQSA